MSPEQIAAWGALLSGIGSVVGAWWAKRRIVRDGQQECDKRMRAYIDGLKEGRHELYEDTHQVHTGSRRRGRSRGR